MVEAASPRPLVILRPEPGATATATAATAQGLNAVKRPLFAVQGLVWSLPDLPAGEHIDAVMMTSANAARLAGPDQAKVQHLPLYAVGAATAKAARAHGWRDVHVAGGDAAAVMAAVGHSGARCVLYLAGRERTPIVEPPDLALHVVPVYATVPLVPEALPPHAVILVHSARAAGALGQWQKDCRLRASLALVTISAKVAAAAGSGWQSVAVAVTPDDAAMLALAVRLCKTGSDGAGGDETGPDDTG